MRLDSGHEVVPLDDDETAKITKDFAGLKDKPMMRLNPGRSLLPMKFLEFANRIYNFEIRESDVVVLTYPKCGTTWSQEIIWTMRNNPDLNHPWASRTPLGRSPFLEFDMILPPPEPNLPRNPIFDMFEELCPGKDFEDGANFQLAKAIPDPRTLKTHLPFSLMPPSMLDTCKVVYLARNPKDTVVSYHHHSKIASILDYVGSFEDYVQYFIDDDLLYGPYWLYLKEAWERRHHPNLHIIFYEDLKTDTLGETKKLNSFLKTDLTEAQMESIVEWASFAKMKEMDEARIEKMTLSKGNSGQSLVTEEQKKKKEYIEKEGGFFRKGEVGDWKNRMTPDQSAKIDQWVQKNVTNIGVEFRYEN